MDSCYDYGTVLMDVNLTLDKYIQRIYANNYYQQRQNKGENIMSLYTNTSWNGSGTSLRDVWHRELSIYIDGLWDSILAIPQLEDWSMDYDLDELCSKVAQHLGVDDALGMSAIQDHLMRMSQDQDQKELIGF